MGFDCQHAHPQKKSTRLGAKLCKFGVRVFPVVVLGSSVPLPKVVQIVVDEGEVFCFWEKPLALSISATKRIGMIMRADRIINGEALGFTGFLEAPKQRGKTLLLS